MICSKCKQDLNINQFSFKNKTKGIYNKYCRQCKKQYSKKHYLNHKEKYLTKAKLHNKKQKQKIKLYIQEYKHQLGCLICNERDACCLDFHHLDPSVKDFNIGRKSSSYLSIQQFELEISKCVVLCANCHRKLHAGNLQLP